MSKATNPSEMLYKTWQRLKPLPGGIWLFNQLIKWIIPYTGSMGSKVKILEPGYARIELPDHRAIRNHLNSIHAIALANLGEFTSGLAMLSALPADVRGIPTNISIEYLKKARGLLVAESRSDPPKVTEKTDYEVYTDIRDLEGDIVARVTASWRLSPIEV
jgi:acyl-coenzyme A thioesterase PaaI-like protein